MPGPNAAPSVPTGDPTRRCSTPPASCWTAAPTATTRSRSCRSVQLPDTKPVACVGTTAHRSRRCRCASPWTRLCAAAIAVGIRSTPRMQTQRSSPISSCVSVNSSTPPASPNHSTAHPTEPCARPTSPFSCAAPPRPRRRSGRSRSRTFPQCSPVATACSSRLRPNSGGGCSKPCCGRPTRNGPAPSRCPGSAVAAPSGSMLPLMKSSERCRNSCTTGPRHSPNVGPSTSSGGSGPRVVSPPEC